jgi:hypothetical protein
VRQLNLIHHAKMAGPATDIAKYKKQTEGKKINGSLELKLLDEIRMGKRDAIPKLVDSWEYVIINVIEKQIDNRSLSIEKMFNIGRDTLTELAERELGSTKREMFFRFGAWCVRQVILKESER